MPHKLSILIISAKKEDGKSATILAMSRLEEAIKSLGYPTVLANTASDGKGLVSSYHGFGCIILDADIPSEEELRRRAELQAALRAGQANAADAVRAVNAVDIIQAIRSMDKKVPIFLTADRTELRDIPLEIISEVHEYIYPLQDTADFIAGRVDFATRRYYEQLLPPYFGELKKFTEDAAYSWDAPGHMGGVAYLKHPVGMQFHQFFGENIMRADIGISTAQMGDWLEHIGPSNESECNAARIFGADWTFYVLGGSSASNRIVCQGAIGAEEMVVADRNCHKSLNHGLTLSRARAVYLKPTRNSYGMIGPIQRKCFEPQHIKELIDKSELKKGAVSPDPTYGVVTNCTYDGFCYDVNSVVDLLSMSVDRIHFDEAWYAYAKFHPVYAGRFAMGLDRELDRTTIFAVQSTHKMLPAFSMASMIHIKVNKVKPNLEKDQFNEAFMMHGTTSPFYPMIASIDVATSMMDDPAGRTMMDETIEDAIGLRKAIASVGKRIRESDEKNKWFFGCYQPDKVVDPKKPNEPIDFEDAPDSLLANEPSCWTLKESDTWHGFQREDLSGDNYCMLDPTKVTILCPGINARGEMDGHFGIPGTILTHFLDSRRIEIARTGDYTVLVLFSVGTSKGKWGTLLEALLEFKRLYDSGASVAEVLPELAEKYPEEYGRDANGQPKISLKELCQNMHSWMKENNLPKHLNDACNVIPPARYSSAETYQKLIRDQTERVRISEIARQKDRIAGHMLVPYPPGIPILMPGEVLEKGNPQIKFLLKLEKFNGKFPGFEREIHGVEIDENGNFCMRVVKSDLGEKEEETEEMRLKQGEAAPAFKPAIRRRVMSRAVKRGRS
ncbi:MAG: Orn/Lys/Arg decarboxylase, major domain [Methanosaeta sp. PtaU1.Bin112]|nr:MAG: Orn/Lys/Arg decarboxylase, major domain [Methanosaeta sp. PtaU1.Bin112]